MIWQGRFDGNEPLYHRVFQRVSLEDNYEVIQENDFVLHGFSVDEGVKRNKGRAGAQDAPDVIRKNMCNFPVTHAKFNLKDFGNIDCDNQNLEKTQNELAEKVSIVLQKGGKSVVFGGGHEITFAHYSGIRKAFPTKKIGIINIDAHFDNREIDQKVGASSGTGFWQIAQEGDLHTLHIGIQRHSNTLKLFDTAHQYGMKYILAEELFFENLPTIYAKLNEFIDEADVIYLTICMDVFNVSIAPGVSALAYNGIFADSTFMHLFKKVLSSEKLMAMDAAEVNPTYDQNEITARLAASLINEWFMIS